MRLKRNVSKLDKFNYENIYVNRLEAEAKWLKEAAVQRCDNIEYFLKKKSIHPISILDIGCGTGAVIKELQSRNIGKEYLAVDYSKEAVEHLKKNSEGIKTQVSDFTSNNVAVKGSFDLVLVIHILQHVDDPDKFIKNILSNIKFSYLIIEVPLEDLIINKIVSMLGMSDKNPTGTLQFFNKKTIIDLLNKNGLSIVNKKSSTPKINLKTLRILKKRYNWNKIQFIKKIFTTFLLAKLLGPVKRTLHYSYFSVLCVNSDKESI